MIHFLLLYNECKIYNYEKLYNSNIQYEWKYHAQ